MLSLKVWGDYACFTRPEFKTERVSYDVMTPSAARGILEAILWKPEMQWRVREIVVLNEVKRLGIVRNEVKGPASRKIAQQDCNSSTGLTAIQTTRTLRHSLVLKDVAYLIRAEIQLRPEAQLIPLGAYHRMFLRRVRQGQAFHTPYLGNREFSAFFSLPDGTEQPANIIGQLGGKAAEQAGQLPLGRMLFDIDFEPIPDGPITYRQHTAAGPRWVTGQATPRFFEAMLTDKGVLKIPPHLYSEVKP